MTCYCRIVASFRVFWLPIIFGLAISSIIAMLLIICKPRVSTCVLEGY